MNEKNILDLIAPEYVDVKQEGYTFRAKAKQLIFDKKRYIPDFKIVASLIFDKNNQHLQDLHKEIFLSFECKNLRLLGFNNLGNTLTDISHPFLLTPTEESLIEIYKLVNHINLYLEPRIKTYWLYYIRPAIKQCILNKMKNVKFAIEKTFWDEVLIDIKTFNDC